MNDFSTNSLGNNWNNPINSNNFNTNTNNANFLQQQMMLNQQQQQLQHQQQQVQHLLNHQTTKTNPMVLDNLSYERFKQNTPWWLIAILIGVVIFFMLWKFPPVFCRLITADQNPESNRNILFDRIAWISLSCTFVALLIPSFIGWYKTYRQKSSFEQMNNVLNNNNMNGFTDFGMAHNRMNVPPPPV